MIEPVGARDTERLCLVPIGPERADDLLRLHQDSGIARWYGSVWAPEQAQRSAAAMGRGWLSDGVHKWLAYDRADRELIGRGGPSYAEVDGACRLEIGWAVRERFWGQGYASEIGRAGLAFAFDELDVAEVVSFTEAYNKRSRAVMQRLGFRYLREIRHRGEPFAFYALWGRIDSSFNHRPHMPTSGRSDQLDVLGSDGGHGRRPARHLMATHLRNARSGRPGTSTVRVSRGGGLTR